MNNKEYGPLPKIVRFPDEPKLVGVPHNAKQSVFLNTPGLSRAMGVISDLKDSNSDQRQRYLFRLEDSLSKKPGQQKDLISALVKVRGSDLTESAALKSQANLLLKKLKPEDEKITYEFNHELFDALKEVERFSEHLERFGEYFTTPEKKRRNVVANQARKLFDDPKALVNHAINTQVITQDLAEEQSDQATAYNAYDGLLQASLSDLAAHPDKTQLDRRSLAEWMKVLCLETKYSPVAEKLLANWLTVRGTGTIVDRVHQLATAAYTSENKSITQKMLDITGLQTSILPFDSQAAIEFVAAPVIGSDKVRQQKNDIENAEDILAFGPIYSKQVIRNMIPHVKQKRSRLYKDYILELVKESANEFGASTVREVLKKPWRELFSLRRWRRLFPQNIARTAKSDPLAPDTPLRRWINEKITLDHETKKLGRKKRMIGEIQLPGVSRVVKAPVNQLANEVRERLSLLSDHTLDQPENLRTLALLVPNDTDQKKLDKLQEVNAVMRRQIIDDRLRNISKRGDRIHITSEQLKALGFRGVELYQKEQDDYDIRIKVGGNIFAGAMDSKLELIKTEYGSRLRLPITGAFLEHIIISHMHELLCAPIGEEGNNGSGEMANPFHSRRDHQTILPQGHRPTRKQILKILHDPRIRIDIDARNKARIAAGETRLITWHSPVERIDMPGEGPVESYGEKATEQLDRIFNLNQRGA